MEWWPFNACSVFICLLWCQILIFLDQRSGCLDVFGQFILWSHRSSWSSTFNAKNCKDAYTFCWQMLAEWIGDLWGSGALWNTWVRNWRKIACFSGCRSGNFWKCAKIRVCYGTSKSTGTWLARIMFFGCSGGPVPLVDHVYTYRTISIDNCWMESKT